MRIFLLMSIFLLGQIQFGWSQKREFRAVWLTTVSNLDFPSSSSLTADAQKAEMVRWLDEFKDWGMNAVVFQIRNHGEALYNSPYEPWSEYLTGTQGTNPNYDPLAYAITESRKRSLEMHAWLNPFRVAVSLTRTTAPNHITNTQPSWVRTYGTNKFLDPGIPEVRRYVAGIVADVVRRYDVDAIHFDDYFYPYPIPGVSFDDNATFAADTRGFVDKNEWRRNNIDLFVKMVSDSIKLIKPHVKFGISPFGIWQNYSAAQPNGSDTRGLESYNAVHADSRRWAQSNWVDYLAPQLYWNIGFAVADYSILADWWQRNAGNQTQLYIGHGTYKVGTSTDWGNTEIGNQIRIARSRSKGSIHFRAKSIRDNAQNCRDTISTLYGAKALVPTMSWLDNTPPPPPRNLTTQNSNQRILLNWAAPTGNDTASVFQKVQNYVIYRFSTTEAINLNNASKIIAITPNLTYLDDPNVQSGVYHVTSLDRLWNESSAISQRIHLKNVELPSAVRQLVIAPNPIQSNSMLTLELSESKSIQIDIYDLQGKKLVQLGKYPSIQGIQTWNLPIDNLPNGISMVVIDIDGVKISRKIVK